MTESEVVSLFLLILTVLYVMIEPWDHIDQVSVPLPIAIDKLLDAMLRDRVHMYSFLCKS